MAESSEEFEFLREVLVKLGVPAGDIVETSRLHADLELDSTESVDITLEVFKRFGAEIKLERENDITVGQLSAMVARVRGQ
jgi:acyl carrier protein